ncbi:hypothetical protein CEXT_626361 [Caerostris extrusa]|uniref:Uncharacterized protein n=1 Tax=Caerostris extrusa TaxID=172846 RepID=A0AAV4W614_CAEEX|nr:hypothetical protein CEXT_626361 [Caerostris extrusa]
MTDSEMQPPIFTVTNSIGKSHRIPLRWQLIVSYHGKRNCSRILIRKLLCWGTFVRVTLSGSRPLCRCPFCVNSLHFVASEWNWGRNTRRLLKTATRFHWSESVHLHPL